jgi:hypothetical protein
MHKVIIRIFDILPIMLGPFNQLKGIHAYSRLFFIKQHTVVDMVSSLAKKLATAINYNMSAVWNHDDNMRYTVVLVVVSLHQLYEGSLCRKRPGTILIYCKYELYVYMCLVLLCVRWIHDMYIQLAPLHHATSCLLLLTRLSSYTHLHERRP